MIHFLSPGVFSSGYLFTYNCIDLSSRSICKKISRAFIILLISNHLLQKHHVVLYIKLLETTVHVNGLMYLDFFYARKDDRASKRDCLSDNSFT